MSKPLIIGHRGASAIAPENTIAAFRMALDVGADGIEFDVRLTRDGIPVVIHDDNLERTGSVPRRVAALSLTQLKDVDVGSWFHPTSFAGERVPTLEEVFELFESTQALLYLEMKCDPAERDRLAMACCESLRASSLKDRVVIECFDLLGIYAVKNIDADIKTAALFEPRLTPRSLPFGGRIADQALRVNADEVALHHRLATKRVIDTARRLGLKVVVWTVDDEAWIRRAASHGITALITNDPGMMVRQRDTLL
jgi:glycerophosphoryl diester phosphodiesterase